MNPARSTRAERLAALPRFSPDDDRVGRDLVGYEELANERGQNYQAMAAAVRRSGIEPVGVVGDRGGRLLFDRGALVAAQVWPLGGPIDPDRECWMADYASSRGFPKKHIESMLCGRVAACRGEAGVVSPEVLAEEGIGRRIGRRWAVAKARADELLSAVYDPSREATAPQLVAEGAAGYSDARKLAAALKRAEIPSRTILPPGGRRTVLYDRDAAMRWTGGRYQVPARALAPLPTAPIRRRVAGIDLRTPTHRTTIPAADAAWLLGVSELRIAAGPRGDEGDELDPTSGVAITWMEQKLVADHDFEGRLLLARMVDGVFIPRPGEGRTQAVLRLSEKTG
jgi:hypothetical protein